MKQAAREIDALPLAERDFALVRVWFERVAPRAAARRASRGSARRVGGAASQRARVNRHHLVTREQLSVRAEMSRLLKVLAAARYRRVHGAVRRARRCRRTWS